MKNQYFGDINDYLKYGLLRLLMGGGEFPLAVCWMLTPDDGRAASGSPRGGRSDGRLTAYLEEPARWRPYDPDLFDVLREWVIVRRTRHVACAEASAILPGAVFHSEILREDGSERKAYFGRFLAAARDCELAFFDPDIGMEVPSRPYGRKHSCMYLYWHELVDAYGAGHSLLVYQHYRRVKRTVLEAQLVQEICRKVQTPAVICYRTPRTLFLLAPQPRHLDTFLARSEQIVETWSSQITATVHDCRRSSHAGFPGRP